MIKRNMLSAAEGVDCITEFKVIDKPCQSLKIEEIYDIEVNNIFYQEIEWSKIESGNTVMVFHKNPESIRDEIKKFQEANPSTVFIVIEGSETE